MENINFIIFDEKVESLIYFYFSMETVWQIAKRFELISKIFKWVISQIYNYLVLMSIIFVCLVQEGLVQEGLVWEGLVQFRLGQFKARLGKVSLGQVIQKSDQ